MSGGTSGADRQDDFEFIESKPQATKKQKGRPSGDYEPPRFEYEGEDEDREYNRQEIKDQVRATAHELSDRPLRYEDQVFFVIDFAASPSSNQVEKVLNRLDADILAYLNREHTRVLVSGSARELFRLYNKVPGYFKDWVHLIRPLTRKEKISSELATDSPKSRILFVRIMPNLKEQEKSIYMEKLKTYLREQGAEIFHEDVTSEKGVIVTQTKNAVAQNLVDNSTFVYHVKPAPEAVAAKIKSMTRRAVLKKKSERPKGAAAQAEPQSLGTELVDPKTLPKIVVLDSGANHITPLHELLVQDGFDSFGDYNDGYLKKGGHGTPISYLAAYGEENKLSARIVSYKIYSDSIKDVAYQGVLKGIEKYAHDKDDIRIFVSSIGLPGHTEEEIHDLDRTVQEKNVCLCVAAGNVDPADIVAHHARYPVYLRNYPVMAPAYAPEIIAVGSYSRRATDAAGARSIAPIDGIAPHSCCGTGRRPLLHDCRKPEVVEHGGNINIIGTTAICDDSIGVSSYSSSGSQRSDFIGTSFSSPQFARKLAIIDGKYHNNIDNVETLKAIALIMSRKLSSACAGYGEGTALVGSDYNHALYVSEGEIQLASTSGSSFNIPFSRIENVIVPKGVDRIDICIVHSDNFKRSVSPSLNTYMQIVAQKTGSDSPVPPTDPDAMQSKTNIKFATYRFRKKSMEAIWSFDLIPDITSGVRPQYRNEIKVRYGCAILLSRSASTLDKISLTQLVRQTRDRLRSL